MIQLAEVIYHLLIGTIASDDVVRSSRQGYNSCGYGYFVLFTCQSSNKEIPMRQLCLDDGLHVQNVYQHKGKSFLQDMHTELQQIKQFG